MRRIRGNIVYNDNMNTITTPTQEGRYTFTFQIETGETISIEEFHADTPEEAFKTAQEQNPGARITVAVYRRGEVRCV